MSTKVLEGLFILQSFTTTLIMSLLHGVKLITHKDNVSSPEESFKDMQFAQFNSHTSSLFHNSNIIKFTDTIHAVKVVPS